MSHSDTPVYKRVLLKLSGEALSAGADGILNHEYLDEIVEVIKRCMDKGVQKYMARTSGRNDGAHPCGSHGNACDGY